MKVNLFVATDPQGRVVRLTTRCYTEHIVVEHPDLADAEEIERTIRTPDYIAQDAVDPTRLVYYRLYRRQPQRWLIKVVVEDGEIITAYRVKRLKEGERIQWRR